MIYYFNYQFDMIKKKKKSNYNSKYSKNTLVHFFFQYLNKAICISLNVILCLLGILI